MDKETPSFHQHENDWVVTEFKVSGELILVTFACLKSMLGPRSHASACTLQIGARCTQLHQWHKGKPDIRRMNTQLHKLCFYRKAANVLSCMLPSHVWLNCEGDWLSPMMYFHLYVQGMISYRKHGERDFFFYVEEWEKVMHDTQRSTKCRRWQRQRGERGMEVTAEKRARGGFTITHMLHSIIRSFVRRTMRARGTGLKKDRHTATASDPGETRAKPEVSEKKKTWTYTESVFTILPGGHYFSYYLLWGFKRKINNWEPAFGEQAVLHWQEDLKFGDFCLGKRSFCSLGLGSHCF